jgi:hypothetical protein
MYVCAFHGAVITSFVRTYVHIEVVSAFGVRILTISIVALQPACESETGMDVDALRDDLISISSTIQQATLFLFT